jgi:hypothetical protein
MLPRSAVRKAAAGQRPALRGHRTTGRGAPDSAGSSAPARASAALGEPSARLAAVRSRSRASWAWLSSGAVSDTVTYPITGSLPVMAQRSSARPVWHRSGSHSGSPDTGSCPARTLVSSRSHDDPASNARLRPAFHQPGHDAARVFGVLDQMQHPEQHDCRRLPGIERLRRPAQNHPGITQVSLEVIGRALRGALEQRLCVQGFLIRR